MPEHIGGVCDPIPVRKSRYVEIVPHLIAPDDQVALDPQGFVWRRHPEHVPGWQAHLNYFQWPFPDELPDAGLDIAQLAQDDLAGGHPVRHPSIRRFDRVENGIKSVTQIFEHVIVVERRTVVGPGCRSRTADEHGIRDRCHPVGTAWGGPRQRPL